MHARMFVNYVYNPLRNGLSIQAIFRWDEPQAVNEIILGYKISCWYQTEDSRNDLFNDFYVQPETNEIQIDNLTKEMTVYCKVKMETIIGEASNWVLANTSTNIENPIPRLFIANNADIYTVDLDLKRHKLIVSADSRVIHMCFFSMAKQLFWTNKKSELMSYSSGEKKKLFSINAVVLSITVDWIEQILYWAQTENRGSSINALNLNTLKSNVVLQLPKIITKLIVAPMNRELFWIESESQISTQGTFNSYRFGDDHSSVFRDAKNAPIQITKKTLFLDTFIGGNDKILWLNEYKQLMSTDIRLRVSTPSRFSYNSNMMNINRDSVRMYWTEGDTVVAEKPSEQVNYEQKLFYPMIILPTFHQNYPKIKCLLPPKNVHQKDDLALFDSSDRSLWLRMPVPKRTKNCLFEPILLKYRILYAEMDRSHTKFCLPSTCNIIETREKMVEVSNLKPDTKYQMKVGISNYYSEKYGSKMKFTRTRIFRTKVEAPSPSRNMSPEIHSSTSKLQSLQSDSGEIGWVVFFVVFIVVFATVSTSILVVIAFDWFYGRKLSMQHDAQATNEYEGKHLFNFY